MIEERMLVDVIDAETVVSILSDFGVLNAGIYVKLENGDEAAVKSYTIRRYSDKKVEIVLSPFPDFEP